MNMPTINRHLLIVALMFSFAWIGGCATKEEGNDKETPSFAEDQKPKASYGKIKSVDVGTTINASMAKSGKEVFEMKCTACHKYDERYVGPALGKVVDRRTPVYIMNMILDTETMIENDDTVKCLLQEYMMKMPNQSVDEKEARSVLEHLREHAASSK